MLTMSIPRWANAGSTTLRVGKHSLRCGKARAGLGGHWDFEQVKAMGFSDPWTSRSHWVSRKS